MREIKFRAWDNIHKRWLLSYDRLGGFSMFGECMLFEEWSNILNRFILQQKDRKPEDLILMQFTGLLDKNGKEIYDGDILVQYVLSAPVGTTIENNDEIEYLVPPKPDYLIGKCEFRDASFYFIFDNEGEEIGTIIDSDMEIIGNIYQNPELTNN